MEREVFEVNETDGEGFARVEGVDRGSSNTIGPRMTFFFWQLHMSSFEIYAASSQSGLAVCNGERVDRRIGCRINSRSNGAQNRLTGGPEAI
ncbi:hypothetical protein AB6A40_005716 [Gnathostoma spinigerum]|uniref:Uncharacterized protein n=1 Tax=Gnathostoma spinigerum TaxID=75299 RepID=A0ABD6EQN9_9BILA